MKFTLKDQCIHRIFKHETLFSAHSILKYFKMHMCKNMYCRAATDIRFVRIFIRILVFGFDLFAFGIRLHGIYVIYGKITYYDTD